MIDLKKLRELVKLMTVNDLTELDLQGEGERVTLKRTSAQAAPTVQYTAPPAQASAAPPAGSASAASTPPAASEDDKFQKIASPMVGTFYAASSPDAKPFASVGDRVEADTVVCIIEAMKVFNEIRAETSGVIERVMVDNGQAVEYGQALFLVAAE